MKKVSGKIKYRVLKISAIFINVVVILLVTTIGILLHFDELWRNIETEGITTFQQWITLISYRLGIYLIPGFVLSFFKFDKRYKYASRLKIWFNWTFCIYLVVNVVIKVFAIDKVLHFEVFNTLDSAVLLTGYVITFVTKEKVDFTSTEAITNPKNTQ